MFKTKTSQQKKVAKKSPLRRERCGKRGKLLAWDGVYTPLPQKTTAMPPGGESIMYLPTKKGDFQKDRPIPHDPHRGLRLSIEFFHLFHQYIECLGNCQEVSKKI
jgi:hypothetical protein